MLPTLRDRYFCRNHRQELPLGKSCPESIIFEAFKVAILSSPPLS